MKDCCFSQYMQTNIPVYCHACMKERQEKLRETYLENMNLWNYNRRMAIEEEKEMEKQCVNCRKAIPGTDIYELGNPLVCTECVEKRKREEEHHKYRFEHNGNEYQTFLKEVEMPVGGNLPELTSVTLERTPMETVRITTTSHFESVLRKLASEMDIDELITANRDAIIRRERQSSGHGFGLKDLRKSNVAVQVYETEIGNRLARKVSGK